MSPLFGPVAPLTRTGAAYRIFAIDFFAIDFDDKYSQAHIKAVIPSYMCVYACMSACKYL
jgi:hypothetical protein